LKYSVFCGWIYAWQVYYIETTVYEGGMMGTEAKLGLNPTIGFVLF
jgi:hypothetical protein